MVLGSWFSHISKLKFQIIEIRKLSEIYLSQLIMASESSIILVKKISPKKFEIQIISKHFEMIKEECLMHKQIYLSIGYNGLISILIITQIELLLLLL
jgi:hypothetical protein